MKTIKDILQDIENLAPSVELVVIDLFCGAGGFSWGVEKALVNGRKVAKVLICVNHDALAIASHYANMPEALHFVEDIRTVGLAPMVEIINKVRKSYPYIKVMLHASLECTNHSKAKGGMSRDADSRTLADHLFRYVTALSPDYISIENVEEFMIWGPLQVKVITDKNGNELYCPLDVKKNKTANRVEFRPVWVPVKERKAEFYNAWIEKMKTHGYKFEHRILNSADYGAYTSRKRFFGLFARPELPISWPQPTHSKSNQSDLFSNLKPWKPVREVLDFSIEGTSIFSGRLPVEATLERIYAGLVKFVAGGKDAFVIKYNSMSQRKTYVTPSIDDSCPVVSTQGRLGVAFISRYYSGNPDSKNSSIESPAGTITTIDHHSVVSAQFLSAYYGNGHNHSLNSPSPTLTTKDRLAYVKPCFLDMQYGNGTPSDIENSAPTITANPKHHLVTCTPWVMNTSFKNIGSSVEDPAHTITADRHWHYLLNPQFSNAGGSVDKPCFTLIARMDKMPPYLMTATTDGDTPAFIKHTTDGVVYEIYDTDSEAMVKIKEFMALYCIADIKKRMLLLLELKRIMGFPDDYVLRGNQENQKKFIGNAVETTQAQVNTEALVGGLLKLKQVA